MEDSEQSEENEIQLLARMQQLSAALLQRNAELEDSLSGLLKDAEKTSTRIAGCHSRARLQQDTCAVSQVSASMPAEKR